MDILHTSLSKADISWIIQQTLQTELDRREEGDDGLAGVYAIRPNPSGPPPLKAVATP